MDIAEWLPTMVQVGALFVGAIYVHGKFSGQTRSEADTAADDLQRHAGDIDRFRDMALTSKTSLEHHLRDCDRRYEEVRDSFQRVERNMENLSRQLGLLVTDRSNRVLEIKTPRKTP
ncbi:MAG: hypothetical protein ACYC8V_09480 [Caulobacteraceae bacterium]